MSMLFNSLEFLIFFPVVTILYFLLPYRWRPAHLLVASALFYAAFVPAYLLILFFLISVDFWAGQAIGRSEGKRRFYVLMASICANAGVLIFFKYFNFINENLSVLAHLLDLRVGLPHLGIILPVGLSFHVFQSVSYTIDVYQKRVAPERNYLMFALYVMFYPQLVAGPIERPGRLLPQLHRDHDFSLGRVVSGLQLMAWGFFKKLVIADNLGRVVDEVWQHPGGVPGTWLVVAVVFFAYQIYCDFSGYTDIARGAARVMGFDLVRNFNFPYRATSVTEFWHRWHVSLSSWIRDYIFFPLAVRFRNWGKIGVVFGLFVAFFFSGLWHGAAWTFVIWGLLHGLVLIMEFLTVGPRKYIASVLPNWLRVAGGRAYVFLFWSFTLVFFRAPSVDVALQFFQRLVSLDTYVDLLTFTGALFGRAAQEFYLPRGGHRLEYAVIVIAVTLLVAIEALSHRMTLRERFNLLPAPVRYAVYTGCLWFIAAGGVFTHRKFIYFVF